MGSDFPASDQGSHLCRASWFFSSHKHLQPSNVLAPFTCQASVISLWISSDLEKENNYPGGLHRMTGIMGSLSLAGGRTDWWGLGLQEAAREIQAWTSHSLLLMIDTTRACPASSVGVCLLETQMSQYPWYPWESEGQAGRWSSDGWAHSTAYSSDLPGGRNEMQRIGMLKTMPVTLSLRRGRGRGHLDLYPLQKSTSKPLALLFSCHSRLGRH